MYFYTIYKYPGRTWLRVASILCQKDGVKYYEDEKTHQRNDDRSMCSIYGCMRI